ncbi:MAG TPA: tyrosine-type recombinase/integrase [Blastocatellia bacterium]
MARQGRDPDRGAEREAALRAHRHWFDCEREQFEQAVQEISGIEDVTARMGRVQDWRDGPAEVYTRSAKSLTGEQVLALLKVAGARAGSGDLAGKRDYALLLLYITTGMRHNEVISLRGKGVTVEEKRIIIRGRVKGGITRGGK